MQLSKSKTPDIDEMAARHDIKGLVLALSHNSDDDRSRDVPGAAVRALARIGPELDVATVVPLARLLGDANALTEGVPHPMLGHLDPQVRLAAASLLTAIGESAAGALAAAVSDSSEAVRSEVARGLRRIGEPALTPVTAVTASKDWGNRAHAVEALGEMRLPQAVPTLARVRDEDPDFFVRHHAVVALGRIGGPEAVAPLVRALDDASEGVRGTAALLLGRVGGPEAERALAAHRAKR